MLDIESKIVDTIFNAVKANDAFPDADVTTGYDKLSAVYPCVVIEEVDNTPYRRTNTDDCAENHTKIIYEVSVYTDNEGHAKTTGKRIMSIVDDVLQGLKFRRVRMNKPLNIERTIFRQYGRWEVIVGKPVEINGNTVYQMYRR